MIDRKNINWNELETAARMLKDAGFEEVCGSMVSDSYTGEVPAYDSNFGTTYMHHWDAPSESDWFRMSKDEKAAWWEQRNARKFDPTITVTLNYASAADLIAALS